MLLIKEMKAQRQTTVSDPMADAQGCHTPERPPDAPLFERPWDEFVIKRSDDGRYRKFTECCGYLTPA